MIFPGVNQRHGSVVLGEAVVVYWPDNLRSGNIRLGKLNMTMKIQS